MSNEHNGLLMRLTSVSQGKIAQTGVSVRRRRGTGVIFLGGCFLHVICMVRQLGLDSACIALQPIEELGPGQEMCNSISSRSRLGWTGTGLGLATSTYSLTTSGNSGLIYSGSGLALDSMYMASKDATCHRNIEMVPVVPRHACLGTETARGPALQLLDFERHLSSVFGGGGLLRICNASAAWGWAA